MWLGPSCALWGIGQHPWLPPTRCQWQTPLQVRQPNAPRHRQVCVYHHVSDSVTVCVCRVLLTTCLWGRELLCVGRWQCLCLRRVSHGVLPCDRVCPRVCTHVCVPACGARAAVFSVAGIPRCLGAKASLCVGTPVSVCSCVLCQGVPCLCDSVILCACVCQ